MDIDELRIAVTILSFVAFIAIMVWAWSKRNKRPSTKQPTSFTDEREGTKP